MVLDSLTLSSRFIAEIGRKRLSGSTDLKSNPHVLVEVWMVIGVHDLGFNLTTRKEKKN